MVDKTGDLLDAAETRFKQSKESMASGENNAAKNNLDIFGDGMVAPVAAAPAASSSSSSSSSFAPPARMGDATQKSPSKTSNDLCQRMQEMKG